MWIKKLFKGVAIYLAIAFVGAIFFGVYMYYRNPSTQDLVEYLETKQEITLEEKDLELITVDNYFFFTIFEYEETKNDTRYLGVNNQIQLIDPAN